MFAQDCAQVTVLFWAGFFWYSTEHAPAELKMTADSTPPKGCKEIQNIKNLKKKKKSMFFLHLVKF